MTDDSFRTPRDADWAPLLIENEAGLAVSVLANGCLLAIEHRDTIARTMVNQVLGSPIAGSVGRLILRTGGPRPASLPLLSGRGVRFGGGDDRVVWETAHGDLRCRVTLWMHAGRAAWFWRVEVENGGNTELPCDALLVQDLGLGDRGFLMGNEAYASQYLDHAVVHHGDFGPVVMSRQNLAQAGRHPWVAHGCVEGAAAFATDALQLFGPAYRDAADISLPFGIDLPSVRLQHETACIALQSRRVALAAGGTATWTFFGLFEPDHAEPSGPADLERLDAVRTAAFAPRKVPLAAPVETIVANAPPLVARDLDDATVAARYPDRLHDERHDSRLLSFFVADGSHNRHVVLGAKERLVKRRHGALLRSGRSMLPDEQALCATCWMHGVFAAQLTIGNTSFHKLLSVSRDPYNITRGSGLRILVDAGEGWRLLAVPSLFEMGLNDCRWIYDTGTGEITVHAVAAGDDAAMQWHVTADGPPCRFLVYGHLVLGERELVHAGQVAVDAVGKRIAFRPDPDWLWARRYPSAVYHLVTSTPDAVEAIGGDELLHRDGRRRGTGHVALRTRPTSTLSFAVVGSMTDAGAAERLATKHAGGVTAAAMLQPAASFWGEVTRGLQITGDGRGVAAMNTLLPWLAHDAMIHLTVPHGLEQYTGAAWGTRDVCQGPVEFLLAFDHDGSVKEILRKLFAQQYHQRGDWPQWFMLEPYSEIQDPHSHGDVIVWPLKALCDYVEATGDLAFLDEPVPWRRDDDFQATDHAEPVVAHIAKLVSTVVASFVPGTHLMRYGEGDWNDSLQPADPALREWMVSSWTVALLYQQLVRYAAVLRRAGRNAEAAPLDDLAGAMRADFNRHLIRDGTVAGYGLYSAAGGPPELLLHPQDTRTGLHYSLLPMTQAILAGLFTPEQAGHHLRLIREHLAFPDGVRLMDKPVPYRGGIETIFRRAESASFFGREIGLMYVHAHLRYAEVLAMLGAPGEMWQALELVNPISVTELLPHAGLRQRNAYFSSSDAAFADRYAATAEWGRVAAGDIAVDGGWRIYSSGPGLFTNALLRLALGLRRGGEAQPLLPPGYGVKVAAASGVHASPTDRTASGATSHR